MGCVEDEVDLRVPASFDGLLPEHLRVGDCAVHVQNTEIAPLIHRRLISDQPGLGGEEDRLGGGGEFSLLPALSIRRFDKKK